MAFRFAVCLLALVGVVACEVYLDERFIDGDAWKDRWVRSESKSDYGEWKLTAGKFYGDAEADKGLQTTQDARFYELSRKFDKTFTNSDKALVVQYTVKNEQTIDCGGGYVKIFSAETKLKELNGDTPYLLMFGPDICGYSTKKVHVIINYDGKNYDNQKEIRCKDDESTHLYTLIFRPDNTYEVKIDGEKVVSGSLEEDWGIVKPKKIKDPEAKKPEDWDDTEFIDDPDDTKPEDYDRPQHIPNPDAKKPKDWDGEIDGEWEPPMIDNPEFKGEWKARQIKNPKYKGTWEQPEIDNPEYEPKPDLYKFNNMGALGFDLWQVKSGTIFDNLLVTDDIAVAEQHSKDTFEKTKEPEKKMKEKIDEEENRKKDEKRKEEEAKKGDGKKEDEEEEDLEDKDEDKQDEDKKEKDEL